MIFLLCWIYLMVATNFLKGVHENARNHAQLEPKSAILNFKKVVLHESFVKSQFLWISHGIPIIFYISDLIKDNDGVLYLQYLRNVDI